MDVAFGVEHHDALGHRVEDGGEFFGIGLAGRLLGGDGGGCDLFGLSFDWCGRYGAEDQALGGFAVPLDRE